MKKMIIILIILTLNILKYKYIYISIFFISINKITLKRNNLFDLLKLIFNNLIL